MNKTSDCYLYKIQTRAADEGQQTKELTVGYAVLESPYGGEASIREIELDNRVKTSSYCINIQGLMHAN